MTQTNLKKFIVTVEQNGAQDRYYMPGKDEDEAIENIALAMDGAEHKVVKVEAYQR
ncbi:MAG: hypothetical protein V3T23_08450 [Nitrososphaerales archaeon]